MSSKSSDDNGDEVSTSGSSKSSNNQSNKRRCLTPETVLLILLIASVIFGFLAGWLIGKNKDFTDDEIFYITFAGTIFMNMLKMMIVPLIVSSLISSLAALDSAMSGRLGIRAVIYYFTTTVIAVILGMALVLSIQPGVRSDTEPTTPADDNDDFNSAYAFMDIILNIFPPNIVEACFRTYKTEAVKEVIPAESLTSADIFNVTLLSGLTVSQSLALMNSKLRKMRNKATAFQEELLDKDEIIKDLNPFLAMMDENDQYASGFMLDIEQTDPDVDTSSLEQLLTKLRQDVEEFRESIDNFNDMLSYEELSVVQNSTKGILQDTLGMQNEMLLLTENLQTSYNDTLAIEISNSISSTMTSLDHVLFVLRPIDQSLVVRKLNAQLMRAIAVTGGAVPTDGADDLRRSFNSMSSQMMNIMIAVLHGLDAKNALNIGHVTESMLQMSVNLMYLMESENMLDTEALDVMASLLDDVSAVLSDLAKMTYQPKTGGIDDLEQLENLLKDLDAILIDMTTIMQSSSDYAVFYKANTTDTVETVYVGEFLYNMNILGLVSFSIAFGVVIGRQGEDGKLVLRFFTAVNEAVMTLVGLIMWYGPIGIFFLILGSMISVDNWAELMESLGLFMATVLSGLLIHGLIVLPLLYLLVTRKNPITYLAGVTQAMFTALGTSSSSATLPITTRCLEENNHISPTVTRFVLPLGATINMDGTGLYEAVAAVFVAQMNGIPLTFAEVLTISLTATFVSIGAAGIPQAGVVTLVIVLTAVGLPTEDVGLILAVDFIVDRFRTMVNVEGDSIGAGIVHHLSRKDLESAELKDMIDYTNSGYDDKSFDGIHVNDIVDDVVENGDMFIMDKRDQKKEVGDDDT